MNAYQMFLTCLNRYRCLQRSTINWIRSLRIYRGNESILCL